MEIKHICESRTLSISEKVRCEIGNTFNSYIWKEFNIQYKEIGFLKIVETNGLKLDKVTSINPKMVF